MTTRKKNEKFKDFYSQWNILIFLWNNFILLFDAKYPGSNNSRVAKTKKENQCIYQNVECVAVKNWDLLKSKKLVGY